MRNHGSGCTRGLESSRRCATEVAAVELIASSARLASTEADDKRRKQRGHVAGWRITARAAHRPGNDES